MTDVRYEARLKRTRRNMNFSAWPGGVARCVHGAAQIAIFPVRYALDESPTSKDDPQGPNPLPKGWSCPLPPLKTRSYTLRQLRDGWVYVWDSVEQTFHEYQVVGEQFIRHTWTEAQLNQDVRSNPGTPCPYLLYSRRSQLRIAYSPVQWTWRICEKMRSNSTAQSRWMRAVDLPTFASHCTVEHGAPLLNLGKCVADILVTGQPAPSFLTTMLPTRPSDGRPSCKAAFEEAWVRGYVPDEFSALFVALDDPLAIVDDLNMNLSGRLAELSQFEAQHQQKMESAEAVHRLCGFDAEPFLADHMKDDPPLRQAYTDDLYQLLEAYDQLERGADLVSGPESSMVLWAAGPIITEAQNRFKHRWGHLPEHKQWQQAVEDWNGRQLWREDVRFDEVRDFLKQTRLQAERLKQHCHSSERDLLTWLERLEPNAEKVYHDSGNPDQTSALMKTAHTLYEHLGNSEHGQQWLGKQARNPTTLFGLALFNFDLEVAGLVSQVARNFSRTGFIDAVGEGDGSTPGLEAGSPSGTTSLATRASEIKGVLDLEAVQSSKLYKSMSEAGQLAFNTLVQVANDHAKPAWHDMMSMLKPAMKGESALSLSLAPVLFSQEISMATQLRVNPHHPAEFQRWLLAVENVQRKITGIQGALRRNAARHDQHAARIAINALQAQLKDLFLRMPHKITAQASGNSRLSFGQERINQWLADLGQSEIRTQLQLKGADQLHRVKGWMDLNLGSALPTLLVGLNAWNLHDSFVRARNDGRFTVDELRMLGANAGYAGNALAALWVGPGWSQAGKMAFGPGSKALKVAEAGYRTWVQKAKTGTDSAKAAMAGEFAAFSKTLILRTVTWAALGAVAAGIEAWQISKDHDRATSDTERELLIRKRNVVIGMAGLALFQSGGAALGYWLKFAWVMSGPVMILIAILGIAYLMISVAANRYKREGLRLWLYRCSWGYGTEAKWQNIETGHELEMQALFETLQRPSVIGKAITERIDREFTTWRGFWLQVQIPRSLAGETVTLQPALLGTKLSSFQPKDLAMAIERYVDSCFVHGNWIGPEQLGELPSIPGKKQGDADYIYTDKDQYFLWQTWIDTSQQYPELELEVRYPEAVLKRHDGRGYLFRLALQRTGSEADRLNTAFSGELKKGDTFSENTSASQLILAVPVPTAMGDQ